MYYHPSKCHSLKMGPRFEKLHDMFTPYTLKGQHLDTVVEEKDLGVIIDCDLSFESHLIEKISKANKVVGIIRRFFSFLNAEMFLALYKALVRLHLEYANQVWSP